MSELLRFKFFLWRFAKFKVPLIGCVNPKLVMLNEEKAIIKIPLKRRSKNHLGSMYLGALAIGADLAGGLHGFYHANKANAKISLAFKSMNAQFLRRPEADVYFISSMGLTIHAMLEEAQATGQRINKPIEVTAVINYPTHPEEVAKFTVELSLKVI